jgi:chromosome segregation ATPase
VLQEAPFDLTKYVSPAGVGFFALCVYVAVDRIQRWRKSDSTVRAGEIEKAVGPYKEQADNAERLKGQYKEERDEERRAHGECEKKVERLTERLEIESETKDELQAKVMRLLARLEKAETRIEVLESGKSPRVDS